MGQDARFRIAPFCFSLPRLWFHLNGDSTSKTLNTSGQILNDSSLLQRGNSGAER